MTTTARKMLAAHRNKFYDVSRIKACAEYMATESQLIAQMARQEGHDKTAGERAAILHHEDYARRVMGIDEEGQAYA